MRDEQTSSPTTHHDIAIIGMGCMYPGAPNLTAYWNNIISKVDSITDPPPEAWDSDIFYDPTSGENDRVYCKRGGYLGEQAYFNPLDHGVMPRALEGGEPDQWLALQVAHDALADAGYPDGPNERHQTAVILGKGTYINRGNLTMVQHSLMVDQTLLNLKALQPDLTDEQLQLIRKDLKSKLPTFNTETAAAMVPNIVAGRIANRLDLMGPSYTVDAACASSLVAIDMAVRGLRDGEYDMALAGGVQVTTPVPILTLFSQLKGLSLGEQIKPFDKDADGTILGEGIGIVVLKRLADAERDGDRIYAVIKGVGVASDGRGASVLAPRIEGEELALRRAYEQAGVDPQTVGLIEAHGTATIVGDAAELTALTNVFGERTSGLPWCALGTVKSMIGHTMPAAGVAGVIKSVLALYHKVLPPTLNVEQPSPRLELDRSPFYINTETRPWIHGDDGTPRRAGVNAFGFGGINAHTVLEEYPTPSDAVVQSHQIDWETEVCILRAVSRPELLRRGAQLQQFLESATDVALKDIAYTLNTEAATASGVTLAIVASSAADLQEKLEQALGRLRNPAERRIKTRSGIYYFDEPLGATGKLAFLFPGEGSQYLNMLGDLAQHFPKVRACFDEIDRVYRDHARGYVPSDVIFPRPAFSAEERKAVESGLWQMDVAIEALLTANHALYTLLDDLGIKPDVMLGHSTGEYSAMRANGMLGNEHAFGERLLELNQLYQGVADLKAIPRAHLIAVGAAREQVVAAVEGIKGEVYPAMDNCAHQVVLAVNDDVLEATLERLRGGNLVYEVLSFDRPYHAPSFLPYAEVLQLFLASWIQATPHTPLYSCTTTAVFPDDVDEIRRIAFEHWCQTVEFRKTIEAMYADGVRLFVEVGPRGNLTAFVDDILRGQTYAAIPSNVMRRSGITQLNHLVALLAAHGVTMTLEPMYVARQPRKLQLDRVPEAAPAARRPAAVKLPTGWPPMQIGEETAAKIRGDRQSIAQAGQPAEGTPTSVAPSTEQSTAMLDTPAVVAATNLATEQAHLPTPPTEVAPVPLEVASSVEPPQPSPVVFAQPMPHAEADLAMRSYLQTMESFLAVQQDVMQAFLTRQVVADVAPPLTPAPAPSDTPMYVSQPTAQQETSVPPVPRIVAQPAPVVTPALVPTMQEVVASASVPVAPSATKMPVVEETVPALNHRVLSELLLRLVSERTGYPTEMLNLDLDLEADLGIDSIKRIEIISALRQETPSLVASDVDELTKRRTLQAMVDFLIGQQRAADGGQAAVTASAPVAAPNAGAADDVSAEQNGQRLPFVQTITRLVPGELAEVVCEVTVDRYPFLHHHTLGRDTSQFEPQAGGLAVMPFTMSMEILAEVAQLLVPDQLVVGMKELRASRWVALDAERVTLNVVATRRPEPWSGEVHVQLRDTRDSQGDDVFQAQPRFEGTILFAAAYPDAPVVEPTPLVEERPSRWTPEQLYQEGMFHGPMFRGVASMDRWGSNGAVATLRTLPRHELFAREQPTLTDGVLLDQPGQVLAFWMAEHLERAYVIFPFHLESLQLYGPILPEEEKLVCHARVTLLNEQHVRANFDIVRSDGRGWATFTGWEDRRFDVPPPFFRFLLAPVSTTVSTSWTAPIAGLAQPNTLVAVRVCVDDFPEGFFSANGGIWQRVLTHMILDERERAMWDALQTSPPRRLEWLLGRLAAKDAVREYLRAHYDLALCPADIAIVPNEDGLPVAQGLWQRSIPHALSLSISHTAGIAVAMVGIAAEGTVGVDIAVLGDPNGDVAKVAFSDHEARMLATMLDTEYVAWATRFWCAKEAVRKAVGASMVGIPQDLEVQEVDTERGSVQIRLPDLLARRAGANVIVMAYTTHEGDVVTAATVWSTTGSIEPYVVQP
jgi:acyl transferase domain-containing protein/phosphopantetheinyl transferase